MDTPPGADTPGGLRSLAEAELLRPRYKLIFVPQLEAAFERHATAERAFHMRLVTLLGVTILNVNLRLDSTIMGDILGRIVVDQLLFASPVMLLTAWLWFRPGVRRSVQDRAVFFNSAVATLVTLANVFWSHTAFAPQNFFLVNLCVAICLLVSPMSFRMGAQFAMGVLLLTGIALFMRPDFSATERDYVIQYMVVMDVAALFAVFSMEANARRLFLLDVIQKALIADLSAERRVLTELSATDPLTGTANRRRLDLALASMAQQPGPRWAFLLIDVDFFKDFNDRHGHVAGDQCLREVAAAIQLQLRADLDLLARFGGEEFAVLLPGLDPQNALAVGERIRTGIEAHVFALGGVLMRVTASVGIASVAHTAPDRVVEEADRALYTAKREGRNCSRAAWLLEEAAGVQPPSGRIQDEAVLRRLPAAKPGR